MKTEAKELLENVIRNNYCIGCGACASVKDSPFVIKMDKFGNFVADAVAEVDNSKAKVLEICPFSGKSKNEDTISDVQFQNVVQKDHRIGKYLANYAGFVNDDRFRSKGSSGGLGKWLGYTLLSENKIDYFVQVVPNQTKDPSKPLFDYEFISDKDLILKGSKSSYYPVTLDNVIKKIRENDGRYAITGIPCFIKTIRLMSLQDEKLKQRIKYCIGIICGGMKSANHAKMIGWQLGIKPENLVAIDFRRKYKDKPASYKIYQAWSNIDNKERFRDSYDIYGTDWGAGFFKPNACDYCDDVVGETADISIGDAWLPSFEQDARGNTITVIRNNEILALIEKYRENGQLHLDKLTAEDVAKSQAGGLRHRREALSFRIAKKEAKNEWYPEKRVKANEFKVSRKRKRIYTLREKIAKQSHISFYHALQKDSLEIFYKEMRSLCRKYHCAVYGSLPVRGIKKAKRIIMNMFNKSFSGNNFTK